MNPTAPGPATMTIGRLARAADVGIETIRYYQQRGLLPLPTAAGTFRHYPVSLIDRIRFVKRAQELGHTLAEIAELLRLEDGADRASIRRIAANRLAQVEQNLADLRKMRKALMLMLDACSHAGLDQPCPIIATLTRPKNVARRVAAAKG